MKKSWITPALIVLVIAVWLGYRVWTRANDKPASESTHNNVKKLVERHPELKPTYDRALEDDVLTLGEAQAILDEGAKLKKND